MPPSDGAGPSRPVVVVVWTAFLGWTTWCAATDPVPKWPFGDWSTETTLVVAACAVLPPILALVIRERRTSVRSRFHDWFFALSPNLMVAAGGALAGIAMFLRAALGESPRDAMIQGSCAFCAAIGFAFAQLVSSRRSSTADVDDPAPPRRAV